MKRLAPHWQILIALGLATITALVLRGLFGNAPEASSGEKLVSGVTATCGFIGDLFMRALKMIIVPLIVTAVVSGITGLKGVEGFGRLGIKTMVFYLTSSLAAILVGLVLVNLIEPGLNDGKPNTEILAAFEENKAKADPVDIAKVEVASQREGKDFLSIFKAMIPENVVDAASDNGQMLGVIIFSILFAITVTQLPGHMGNNVRDFFEAANEAMVTVTKWIMAVAPIGVYALILPLIHKTGMDLFGQLGKYFFTVLFGLLIHFTVILPLALRFIGKVSPKAHFMAMRPALLMAFSTASAPELVIITLVPVSPCGKISASFSASSMYFSYIATLKQV